MSRIQGRVRMATGPFKSPFYLILGGPVPGTMWLPQMLTVVSNDDFTVPAGAPFFTTSMGQGEPQAPGGILTGALLNKAVSIPGVLNFAALNLDFHMHYGDTMWIRIGGAPTAGTPFTAILHFRTLIPAGDEELNVL